jgi:hypothetical protein
MSIELIVHAIVLAVAFAAGAYVVFVSAQKAEGPLKPIGVILAALLAAIGALVLIAHLTAPMFGGRPFGMGPAASSTPAASASGESGKTGGESQSGGGKS